MFAVLLLCYHQGCCPSAFHFCKSGTGSSSSDNTGDNYVDERESYLRKRFSLLSFTSSGISMQERTELRRSQYIRGSVTMARNYSTNLAPGLCSRRIPSVFIYLFWISINTTLTIFVISGASREITRIFLR